MIIQPILRSRRQLFRTASQATRCFSQTAPWRAGSAHTFPILKNDAEIRREGFPGLYSPEGVDIAWVQYHQLLLDKLNTMTAGSPEEHKTPEQLLLQYARDPMNASLFNYASMAFNNHFFFKGITRHAISIPDTLAASLAHDFGSLETLRADFLATANSMFGPGFVWLVKTRQTSFQSSFRILSTYIAGSPLAGAHFRRQGVDQNTQSAASASSSLSPAEMAKMGQPVNSVGAMGAHSAGYNKGPKVAYGGIEVTPLLCVSTWEHSWLRDWQITGGKENFLTAWWDRIDWEVVNTLAGDSTKGVGGFRTGKSVKEGGQYGFNR